MPSAYYTTPVTVGARITELVKQYGSLRTLSSKIKLSEPHLCKLRKGGIEVPTPATLRKLGLVKSTTYTRRAPAKRASKP